MLDLGKPYGTYDGLTFFGDHKEADVVYYFPDQVSLAQRDDGKGALSLLLFTKNEVTIGSPESLLDGMGSFLQLDVVCQVEERRLRKALEKVKKAHDLPESTTASTPLWVDGTVQLVVFDSASGGEMGEFATNILTGGKPSLAAVDLKSSFMARLDRVGTDLVYSSLIGKKGSFAVVYFTLSYEALRPARDLRIWANLKRCQETVSHELGIGLSGSYEGFQGEINVDLGWLTTKMEEKGDIKIECANYVPGEDKLTDDLVKDFKDQVIKELFEVRQVAKADTGKDDKEGSSGGGGAAGGIADGISNGIAGGIANAIGNAASGGGASGGGASGGGASGGHAAGASAPAGAATGSAPAGGGSGGGASNGGSSGSGGSGGSGGSSSSSSSSSTSSTSGSGGDASGDASGDSSDGSSGFQMPIKLSLSYSYRNETIKEDRVIEVDYHQASAVVRTHTPQSGLWLNSKVLKGDLSEYVVRNTTNAWTAQSTSVRLVHNFDDPANDLNSVEIRIWRAIDGIQGPEGGFQNPQDKKPLYSRKLTQKMEEGEKLEWESHDENDIGYYYQMRFEYADKSNICSPSVVLTPPMLSYSMDLPIFPNQYAYYKRYPISTGGVDWSAVSSVDLTVDFVSQDGTSQKKKFSFSSERKDGEVIVRGKDNEPVSVFVTKKYALKKGGSVETKPIGLFYDEIEIPHPTYEKDISVRFNKPSDDILNIDLEFEVHSEMFGTVLNKMVPLDPSAGRVQVIQIPIYDMTDTIFYKAYLFTEGEIEETLAAEGSCPAAGNVRIGLDLSDTRPVAFVWKGDTPKSLGVKYVEVVLKDSRGMVLKDEVGQEIRHAFEDAESWEAKVPARETIMMDLRVCQRGRSEQLVKENLTVDFDKVEIGARAPYLFK